MNNDYIAELITSDLNHLCHDGQPGQEWYVNKAERYQNQAKYARGNPKYADKAKSILGKAKDAYTARLIKRGSKEGRLDGQVYACYDRKYPKTDEMHTKILKARDKLEKELMQKTGSPRAVHNIINNSRSRAGNHKNPLNPKAYNEAYKEAFEAALKEFDLQK